MEAYHVPHAPRRRALNPATGQGCQGQELPTWLGRLPREHRQGMLMFLSQGRGGCASNHNGDPAKPLPLWAHSLTGQTLECKERWRPCIPRVPKDGEPPLSRCPCLLQAPDPMSLLSLESLVPLKPCRTGLTVLLGSLAAPRMCLAHRLREEAQLHRWGSALG